MPRLARLEHAAAARPADPEVTAPTRPGHANEARGGYACRRVWLPARDGYPRAMIDPEQVAALPLDEVRRLHDSWIHSQPPDTPTFGGPDGNLYLADDEAFWRAVELAVQTAEP